jgi:hypothetical protein
MYHSVDVLPKYLQQSRDDLYLYTGMQYLSYVTCWTGVSWSDSTVKFLKEVSEAESYTYRYVHILTLSMSHYFYGNMISIVETRFNCWEAVGDICFTDYVTVARCSINTKVSRRLHVCNC